MIVLLVLDHHKQIQRLRGESKRSMLQSMTLTFVVVSCYVWPTVGTYDSDWVRLFGSIRSQRHRLRDRQTDRQTDMHGQKTGKQKKMQKQANQSRQTYLMRNE